MCVSFGGFAWLLIEKKRVQFFFQEPPYFVFLTSCRVVAELNLIHVNDFGCLARDLNLAVLSMVIFLSAFK